MLSLRPSRPPVGFIEPCQPIGAPQPPAGPGWIHEIELDGFRMMAQRRGVGGRLLTRNDNDWTDRYPSVAAAMYALKVKSCLIDGEITVCNERGLARPGGNATGFLMFEYGLAGKWLELLKQIAPRVTRVAVLRDPTIASGSGSLPPSRRWRRPWGWN